MNNYKLFYEKDGKIFGSMSNIPSADDVIVPELNKLFGIDCSECISNQPEHEIPVEPILERKSSKSKAKKIDIEVESPEEIPSPAPIVEEIVESAQEEVVEE